MIAIGDPLVDFALRALVTLLVVIDPVGLVPAYVALVGRRPSARSHVAGRAVVIAGAVLVAFSVIGGPLLGYLGISLGALQVAGGILLFKIAVDMVFAQLRRETPEEAAEARAREDVSVFPLAIPLIAGPGALASMLILTSETTGELRGYAVVLIATIAVLVIAYVLLRASTHVARLLHQTGINVVTRVGGLLLAALAVQYISNGIDGLGLVTR